MNKKIKNHELLSNLILFLSPEANKWNPFDIDHKHNRIAFELKFMIKEEMNGQQKFDKLLNQKIKYWTEYRKLVDKLRVKLLDLCINKKTTGSLITSDATKCLIRKDKIITFKKINSIPTDLLKWIEMDESSNQKRDLLFDNFYSSISKLNKKYKTLSKL